MNSCIQKRLDKIEYVGCCEDPFVYPSCPDVQRGVFNSSADRETIQKYEERAARKSKHYAHGCESKMGEWGADLSREHKCVLISAMREMSVEPGMSLLDWGSGCGHKVAWAEQLFGVRGLGVELVRKECVSTI